MCKTSFRKRGGQRLSARRKKQMSSSFNTLSQPGDNHRQKKSPDPFAAMILKRQFKVWLCLAVVHTNVAFQQHAPPSCLDMTATLMPKNNNVFKDIDIDDVLAQTEQALMAAKVILPSSATVSIEKEWSDIHEMQKEIDTMVGGDEKKKKESSLLQKIGVSFSQKVLEAIEFAHHTKESEEELSKVPERMIKAVQTRANEGIEELVRKANGDLEEFTSKANHDIHELKAAPQKLESTLKKTVTTDNMKKAPGRAFHAAKAFLGSKKVQQASSYAAKAIKDGLESSEMKALQSHAANALLDTMKPPKQPKQPLMDVSDRYIDISDVLAEAEAALMAAESTTESAPPMKKEKSKDMSSNLFQSFMNPKKQRQLVDVSDRDIDISDVLAEAEAALMAAETAEAAPEAKHEKSKVKSANFLQSCMKPKEQVIDVSERDIDISDVLAEAEAALMIAESAQTSASSPSVEKTTLSSELGEKKSSVAWQKTGRDMVAQKWAQIMMFLKLQNDRMSPIRKSNRAILVHNLSDFMQLQKDFLITSRDEIALFVKLQNERLSPIRKSNRVILAHTLKESAIMQKELLITARDKIALFMKMQNDKLSPVRKANRAALAHTLSESVLLQIELLGTARDRIELFVKMQNERMRPIRSSNRINLAHTLSQFLLLQRALLLEGCEQTTLKWSQTMLYLKLQNERMKTNRNANRAILAHNLSELWLLKKGIWNTSRQTIAEISTKLSQIVPALRATLAEDYESPPPEAFLLGEF